MAAVIRGATVHVIVLLFAKLPAYPAAYFTTTSLFTLLALEGSIRTNRGVLIGRVSPYYATTPSTGVDVFITTADGYAINQI
ncbi:hypothetical protein EDB19DRAFT_1920030 [Suillus lakei]|nr:hypothetical protein EDB19DRAFT_1920030 [Suillus lakei]